MEDKTVISNKELYDLFQKMVRGRKSNVHLYDFSDFLFKNGVNHVERFEGDFYYQVDAKLLLFLIRFRDKVLAPKKTEFEIETKKLPRKNKYNSYLYSTLKELIEPKLIINKDSIEVRIDRNTDLNVLISLINKKVFHYQKNLKSNRRDSDVEIVRSLLVNKMPNVSEKLGVKHNTIKSKDRRWRCKYSKNAPKIQASKK